MNSSTSENYSTRPCPTNCCRQKAAFERTEGLGKTSSASINKLFACSIMSRFFSDLVKMLALLKIPNPKFPKLQTSKTLIPKPQISESEGPSPIKTDITHGLSAKHKSNNKEQREPIWQMDTRPLQLHNQPHEATILYHTDKSNWVKEKHGKTFKR